MLVSIIIVNYNTFRITCDCIESVILHTKSVPYEIIVVDNASTKDDPTIFLEKFPQIILIESKENGGFAKGNNLGIAAAKGDIILLLNSDTILTEDSISIATKYITQHTETGALTTKLVYEGGKYQHNARKFRSIKNELLDLLRPLLLFLPYAKRARLMLNQYFKGNFSTQCDWVSGAFMMIPKKVLDMLPERKLDERFFMYGEDQLWCYQFVEMGYKNYFLADTSVIHIANASTEPEKQLKLLRTMLNRELAIMKYRKGEGLYYLTFRLIFVFKEMARYYVKLIAGKLFNYRFR